MEEYISHMREIANCISEKRENILKEAATAGYKYIAIKEENTFNFEENTAIYNFKHGNINTEEECEKYREFGYTIFNLEPVREYLSRRGNHDNRFMFSTKEAD